MAEEFLPGCAKPVEGKNSKEEKPEEKSISERGEARTMLKVGSKAPEFKASSYFEKKFQEVNLSDYRGKWVLLCFYPGDFTFV